MIAAGGALALGVAGGGVAWLLGLPLAWMLGPMIANTIAAMAGAPFDAPMRMRAVAMPVIGVLLGSRITREVLVQAGDWWISLVAMAFVLAAAAAVSVAFYLRVGRYDPVTAYCAGMPGGLADMIALGAALGGDERRIALAHATRILVVICFVVGFYGIVLGVDRDSSGRGWVGLDALSVEDWAILGGCAVLGAPLGRMLRLPAPVIMGPMILSGIAHVAGIVTVSPPTVVVSAALVVMGTTIGCRFAGASGRMVLRDMGMGTVASSLMIAVTALCAWGVATATGTPMGEIFLAYAPGGLTEMALLALATGQDVAYVTVAHLIRITAVVFAAGPGMALLRRRRG